MTSDREQARAELAEKVVSNRKPHPRWSGDAGSAVDDVLAHPDLVLRALRMEPCGAHHLPECNDGEPIYGGALVGEEGCTCAPGRRVWVEPPTNPGAES